MKKLSKFTKNTLIHPSFWMIREDFSLFLQGISVYLFASYSMFSRMQGTCSGTKTGRMDDERITRNDKWKNINERNNSTYYWTKETTVKALYLSHNLRELVTPVAQEQVLYVLCNQGMRKMIKTVNGFRHKIWHSKHYNDKYD